MFPGKQGIDQKNRQADYGKNPVRKPERFMGYLYLPFVELVNAGVNEFPETGFDMKHDESDKAGDDG